MRIDAGVTVEYERAQGMLFLKYNTIVSIGRIGIGCNKTQKFWLEKGLRTARRAAEHRLIGSFEQWKLFWDISASRRVNSYCAFFFIIKKSFIISVIHFFYDTNSNVVKS